MQNMQNMQLCRWSKEYWAPGQPANSEDWSEDFVVLDPRLDYNAECVFALNMKIIYSVCDSLLLSAILIVYMKYKISQTLYLLFRGQFCRNSKFSFS